MSMIVQLETGKCETLEVSEAKRLWFALTGEKRGPAGSKAKARKIKRWFWHPADMPESFKRLQDIETGRRTPELEDKDLPWWNK